GVPLVGDFDLADDAGDPGAGAGEVRGPAVSGVGGEEDLSAAGGVGADLQVANGEAGVAGATGASRFAIGNLEIRSNASGRGKILFPSYAGHGWSTDLSCTGTRVTRIIGKIEVADQRDP